MRSRRIATVLGAITLLGSLIVTVPGTVFAGSGFTRQISAAGTANLRSSASPDVGFEQPEIRTEPDGDASAEEVDRSETEGAGAPVTAASGKRAKSNPELGVSFQGLNHRSQRLANGGNQFSLEPPDQGLCAGNGYVMETVNDVLRVYNTAGDPLIGVVDLNTFYGYAPAINRTTGVQGPFITDPSCYFDQATGRWFHVVLTLEVTPRGTFTGKNHLDLAVSQGSNPTGTWNIYRLPVQDDGTDGTPDHHCFTQPTPPAGRTNPSACLGDYPHIGADANGFYVTTNEYSFFGVNFIGAQIYAFSKGALASGASVVQVVQLNTNGAVDSSEGTQPGFTVWPAISPGTGQFATGAGGTEYFLSSNAADEATEPAGTTPGPRESDELIVWALTNTSSLASATPNINLTNKVLGVGDYSAPPKANQKAGDFPLGQCINDTTMSTPFGRGCWQFLFVAEPAHNEVESVLDSNDSRMQQVTYANGKLWGALDTAVSVGGATKAGVAWYIVKPDTSSGSLVAKVAREGILGLAGNNLTYPAIGVTPSGRGVMAFTVVGNDYYASAGYAAIDAVVGVGDIHIAASGLGPADGFTSYKAFVGNPPRTRWGDYGAAVSVGNSVWIASEYIAQTCTFAQYTSAPFGSCGATRTSLGNWSTRISRVTP